MKSQVAILFVVVAGLNAGNDCHAQRFDELPVDKLEKQLNAILKTRRRAEKDYVKAIVKLVEEEKLPRKLVNSSFKYVRNRRPNTKYPFVYFVRVLQILGKREGVAVPPFDFRIYSTRERR